MGVAQGCILIRDPIVQEEILEASHTLLDFILMSHLTLRNPLKGKSLNLIGRRGRGIPRTICMENLRRQNILPFMVR